jgi:hypothetical protein
VTFSLLILLLLVPPSRVCECARVEAPCAGYWNATAIFVGRVESITGGVNARTATLTVLESFRGTSSSSVEVVTSGGDRECSFPFRIGREYVVYAYRSAETGRLTTSRCSRTRDVEDAGADLTYARALRNGTAPPGRITGQVLVFQRDLAGRSSVRGIPASGVGVRATRRASNVENAGSMDTVTNEAGDFFFDNVG